MILRRLMALTLLCTCSGAAYAQTNEFVFRAHEYTFDLFGSLSAGQDVIEHISNNRIKDDGRLGLGLGANYFATRQLGVGVDAYSENGGDSFVDNVSANLIFRLPFDSIRLAPYAYGGGGYQFDPSGVWFGQAGAGLEFRFHSRVGIFADARYVFTDGTRNIGLARLGTRFSF